jgi:hypothetical protein
MRTGSLLSKEENGQLKNEREGGERKERVRLVNRPIREREREPDTNLRKHQSDSHRSGGLLARLVEDGDVSQSHKEEENDDSGARLAAFDAAAVIVDEAVNALRTETTKRKKRMKKQDKDERRKEREREKEGPTWPQSGLISGGRR